MADEVNFQFLVPGPPAQVMGGWRAAPPAALQEGQFKFKLVDESVSSLHYECRYYDWPQKITFVLSFGFALLFKGFMGSYFKLTVRFDPNEDGRTRVTVVGTAHPSTRHSLRTLAEQNGGPVGLATGI